MVGTICTIPPIKIAMVAKMVNLIGLRSNQVCHPSPAARCFETCCNAGASANSSLLYYLV